MSERISIAETTVGVVSGIRVGVGNVWDEDFETQDGETLHAVRATLAVMGDEPENDFDQRVAQGDEIVIGGDRWRVVSVIELPDRPGNVTLESMA